MTGLYLVKSGVPFDVAFSLPPDEAAAWCVVLGRFDGGEFCETTMQWKDRK